MNTFRFDLVLIVVTALIAATSGATVGILSAYMGVN